MTYRCLNHRNLTYDICRHCTGKMLDCPEYLSDIEHTRLGDKTSNLPQQDVPMTPTEKYSRGVLLQNVRSISEPFLPRPNFLERFYRSQR